MSPVVVGPKLPWKFLEALLGFLSLGLWVGWYWLWMHYAGTRPPTPDPLTGRTYLLDTHGHLVYLLSAERLRLDVAEWTAAISFIAAVLIDITKHPFRK
jgi:hypothetical protein